MQLWKPDQSWENSIENGEKKLKMIEVKNKIRGIHSGVRGFHSGIGLMALLLYLFIKNDFK